MPNDSSRKTKVFCVGWHKTGTSSIAEALRVLGYDVCDYAYKYDPSKPGWMHKVQALLHRHEAFTDVPWPYLAPLLLSQHPNAFFIHTLRAEEEWLESAKRHFGGNTHPIREYLYAGHPDPTESEDVWRVTYRRHNQRMVDLLLPARNYLQMRITGDNKWERLCSFLGREVPDEPFPHVNENATERGGITPPPLERGSG